MPMESQAGRGPSQTSKRKMSNLRTDKFIKMLKYKMLRTSKMAAIMILKVLTKIRARISMTSWEISYSNAFQLVTAILGLL